MKNMVSTVLSKPEIKKIKFSFKTLNITPASFQQVKAKIHSNKIKVVRSNKLSANDAKYSSVTNTLKLGFSSIGGSTDREALIIHECVHAACDIAGKALRVSHAEAVAYVAQCLFFYFRNESALKSGKTPTFASPVLREAWKTATKARSNYVLKESDIKPLLEAIAKQPNYKNIYSKSYAFDGV